MLARAIAFQQLSGRAAGTIWSRVIDLVGEVDPHAFAATTHDELRSAGLSNAKARSLADLSERTIDGRLDLAATSRMHDDAVVEHLTSVRGIGPWSAQMFLMFSLGRTDVWPTGDVGVRNGWMRATGTSVTLTPEELGHVGEPFRPYRSVLAWWCWQEADTRTPGT
ncbi:MAG: DNA-3-methyladenine glycosylase 2 family protein [Actinomycetia bacterium]|nr:DNA-3-methyladenine glycosylase 2 family protein [Actinomycetes bacterium]